MKKYKIGYTCGVFDLFHVGHLNLLERCKELCDKLVVSVCDDDYVRNVKHKEPVIKMEDRLRIIKALRCVDDAFIVNTADTIDKMSTWERIGFNVIFAGDDWKGSDRFKETQEQFAKVGVDIHFFTYTQGVSTTDIRKKMQEQE